MAADPGNSAHRGRRLQRIPPLARRPCPRAP